MLSNILIRPAVSADIPFILAAESVPENRMYIMPWTEEQHRGVLTNPDLEQGIIVPVGENEAAGFVFLAGLTSPDRSIELRRLVVTQKGRGIGRAAVREAKRRAFEELGAHRLWLDVKDHNTTARRLYESEGFVVEGVLRECVRAGSGYESLVVMSILEGEYRPAWRMQGRPEGTSG